LDEEPPFKLGSIVIDLLRTQVVLTDVFLGKAEIRMSAQRARVENAAAADRMHTKDLLNAYEENYDRLLKHRDQLKALLSEYCN
jgi:hypothetical protein